MQTLRPVLRLYAPAKINLFLRVAPVRADGFHPIVSWMVTVGLYDELEMTSIEMSTIALPDGVELSCDTPDIPTDDRNLVVRVVKRVLGSLTHGSGKTPVRQDGLRESAEEGGMVSGSPGPQGARVTLTKRIPAGGGLGGGSSDAVSALNGILALNGVYWTNDQKTEVLSEFGSDLPFFIHAPSAVCTGRGEVVSPAPAPVRARWALLMFPDLAMPTLSVYQRFDEMGLGANEADMIAPDLTDWSTFASVSLMSRLINDLETPAFDLRPDLGHLRASAEQTLGRPVRMSGSGSTLFTLFDTREEATRASEKLKIKTVVTDVAPAPV